MEKITNSIEQKTIELERTIKMTEEKITTAHREFKFEHVFDVSYRSMIREEGLLYLHTSKGVYSYMVKEDPADFIEAFKRMQKK